MIPCTYIQKEYSYRVHCIIQRKPVTKFNEILYVYIQSKNVTYCIESNNHSLFINYISMKKESINIVLQHHNMRRQQSKATRLSRIIILKNIQSTNSTKCRRRIITFGDIIFKPT